jgi:hypothetical protein
VHPFLQAARDGKDAAELLINIGAIKKAKDSEVRIHFITQCLKDMENYAQLLARKAANKEAKDNGGYILLLWAARDGKKDTTGLSMTALSCAQYS